MYTQAIYGIGAGLATMPANTQMEIVPLLARAFAQEPIVTSLWLSLPVVTCGIMMLGGVLKTAPPAAHPVDGTIHALLEAMC